MEIYCKTCDRVLGQYPDEKIPPGVKGHTTCKTCGEKIEIFREAEGTPAGENPGTAEIPPLSSSPALDDIVQNLPLLSKQKDRGVKKADFMALALGLLLFIAIIVIYKPDFDPSKLLPPNLQKAMSTMHVAAGQYEVKRPPDELPISIKPIETISIYEIVALREMLREKRFEDLNKILGKYQQAFEKDPTDEYKVNDAYRIFCNLDSSYEVLLEEWISRFPGDYQPYLAMAEYHYERGWKSRGHAIAKYTTEEQYEGMRSYFSKALEDIDSALAIKSNLLPTQHILIGISNVSSLGMNEDKVIARAIKQFPHSFIIRTTAFWAKYPKWGGSNYEMVKIAEDAEKYADINPRLSSLYGSIYFIQGNTLKGNKKYNKARKLYQKALTYGERARIYKGLAEINFYYDKDYDAALENINRSINIYPVEEDYYLFRSKIYFKMGTVDKASEDLLNFVRINPINREGITKSNVEKLSSITGEGFEGQGKEVNWLHNPGADEDITGWYPYKNAGVHKGRGGNNYFYVRDGDDMSQKIYIPEGTGWHALYVGRASINRKGDEFPDNGLPYISSYMNDDDGRIKNQPFGQQLTDYHFRHNYNDDWVPMWGIWPIHDEATKITFFMRQSNKDKSDLGDIEARFDDLGLYFFKTEKEANTFLKKYFKNLGINLSKKEIKRIKTNRKPDRNLSASQKVPLIKCPQIKTGMNCLENPDAEQKKKGWFANKEVTVEQSSDGNSYFVVRNGEVLMQDVEIPSPSANYVFLAGHATINKECNDVKLSGFPKIHGYSQGDGIDKDFISVSKLSPASFSSRCFDNKWIPMWGIWPIPEDAKKIRLFLDQGEFKDDPIGDTEAYFDDLGLYFFATKKEAQMFLKQYFKNLSTTVDEVKARTRTEKGKPSKESTILVRINNGSVFQLGLGRRVMAYKNNNWESKKVNDHVYHIRFEKWKDKFWKIDTKTKKLTRVSNGDFGKAGGLERHLTTAKITLDDRSQFIAIKTESSSLMFEPKKGKLRLYWGEDLIIDEQYFEIKKVNPSTYHFRIKDNKRFFYKIDLKSHQLYAMRNGNFGHQGGDETILAYIDLI